MNSAYAVIASDATGATGYLMKHNENGLAYRSGDVEELYACVKSVLDDNNKREQLSKNAY